MSPTKNADAGTASVIERQKNNPRTLLPVGLALNAKLGSSRNRGSVFCSPSLAEREVLEPYVDTQ